MGMSKTDKESPGMPVTDKPDMDGAEIPKVIYYDFRKFSNSAPESQPNGNLDEDLDDITRYVRDNLLTRCKKAADKLDESERGIERGMVALLLRKKILSPEEVIEENGRLSIKTKDGTFSVTEFFIRMKF